MSTGVKLLFKIKNHNTPAPTDPSGSPSTAKPLATPGVPKQTIKFVTKPKSAPTVSSDPSKPKKTKAGRATKPSAKLIESHKRVKEETDDEVEEDTTIDVQPRPLKKKIKLSIGPGPKNQPHKTPSTPIVLKAKAKGGKIPARAPGHGYDSEASDREIDPVIEEELMLRMPPGDDCDYLRKAIEEKKLGLSRQQGGADVSMKFFDLYGRRGSVTIRKNVYATVLVDLPCIIEGMKSWDKRGWWKSADICQMLWVFAHVPSEEVARSIPLPPEVDRHFQYPHGITNPMRHVRKLRFRKRLQRSVIESVEEEVNRLLADDDAAIESKQEIISNVDERRASQFSESTPGYDHDDEEDAEGDEDDYDEQGYFGHQPEQQEEEILVDEDFEKELEDAFEREMDGDAHESEAGATPLNIPAAEPEEDSGDDSFDDADVDDEDDGANEISEEEKARLATLEGAREDIAELEDKIRRIEAQLATVPNAILQLRLKGDIRKLQQEVQLKKSSIGEDENIE